jgi:glycosyltransferase involved in cell wall biosynthesis
LKVAVDATPLSAAVGGLAVGGLTRYTGQLVTALAQQFPEDEFILLSDQAFELPCAAPNLRAGRRPGNIWERRWWTFGLQRELKRQGAEVFHGVNFAVPFPATMPAVMTIHDLSPWMTSEGAGEHWVDHAWRVRTTRVRKRVPLLIRTGAARHIITPSEAIRREVIHFFRVDPGRVTAIPLAAAPYFQPQPAVARRPYFLYAGMFEARKNVEAVIAAWSAIYPKSQVELVLAGPHREEASLPQRRPGLELHGVVAESELAALYSGAIALVYPSHYEGFGLPVLEAMQCGTPVIISEDPALIETAGDAGMRADKAGGFAQAMQALLDSPELRAEMRSRSLARAAQFTWERTACATHEVYRSMLAA